MSAFSWSFSDHFKPNRSYVGHITFWNFCLVELTTVYALACRKPHQNWTLGLTDIPIWSMLKTIRYKKNNFLYTALSMIHTFRHVTCQNLSKTPPRSFLTFEVIAQRADSRSRCDFGNIFRTFHGRKGGVQFWNHMWLLWITRSRSCRFSGQFTRNLFSILRNVAFFEQAIWWPFLFLHYFSESPSKHSCNFYTKLSLQTFKISHFRSWVLDQIYWISM